jgi:hypothetical protein
MPDEVIKHIHQIAQRQKANMGLVFLNTNQITDENLMDYHYNEVRDNDYIPDMDKSKGNSDESHMMKINKIQLLIDTMTRIQITMTTGDPEKQS